MKELEKITPLEQDFAKWYTDVVKQGNLIAYGPTKGTIVFKPNSYGIWELIQKNLDEILKEHDVQNVYLPSLIPQSMFDVEKEHIEGFNPELATITKAGKKELNEHYYLRPTSEIMFADLFKKSIDSYNDLPIIYNQWVNIVRWEKTTNPFLRNREFLWQEGHTCHENALDARRQTRVMIKLYAKFLKNYLAIPTIVGKKTPFEKFPGACTTYTVEAMMKDGRALQTGTSHYLAQNFSKPFDIRFKTSDNLEDYVYQTSWGVSTRLIGAIIMSHGDNRGIVIPPRVAPVQIDILELFENKNPKIRKATNKLDRLLGRKWRIRIDSSSKQPGFKAANSEIQGVPLRIEIGPRDIESNQVTLVRRDTLEKIVMDIDDVKDRVQDILDQIHDNLYEGAKKRLNDNTVFISTYDEFKKEIANQKFVIAPFCCLDDAEKIIKEETGATSRCLPLSFEKPEKNMNCFFHNCGKPTKRYVVFAKAY